MRRKWTSFAMLAAVAATGAFGLAALAQEAAPVVAPVAAAVTEAAAAPAPAKIDTGDTAWMLVSTALVLMMTGPGLALFYSGLVRRKNVLATMMQSFVLMGVVSVVWAVCGYSLAFAEGNPFIGGFRFAFLREVTSVPVEYAPTIPHTTWMV